MNSYIIETKRLLLRYYTMEDYNDLYAILTDEETMKHYPKPYDGKTVKRWIEWNINNYQEYGFGLYAVILKSENKFIGDCGITMQRINDQIKPEIGYHLNKNYHSKGYGTEAARACRDYFFCNTDYDEVFSYMTSTNIASIKVAINNQMTYKEEYIDNDNKLTKVYSITRKDWEKLNK